MKLLCALFVVAVAGISPLWAQQPPPLTESNFNVEIYRGPVLGSSRVTALSGAVTAIAEESVSIQFNPASIAQRPYYSLTRFDWYIDWDFFSPGLLQGDTLDFNNSGVKSDADFVAYAVGGGIQYNEFGIGVYWTGQVANLETDVPSTSTYQTDTMEGRLAAGYGFLDHQLIVGAGTRAVQLKLKEPSSLGSVWSSWALAVDAGVIYRPIDFPFRLGFTFASQSIDLGSDSCPASGCVGGFIPPESVVTPWEIRLGGAWYFSFDGQQFNQPRIYNDNSASANAIRDLMDQGDLDFSYLGGRYLLISSDLVFVSRTENAIGVDGLSQQIALEAGHSADVSIRVGAESEVLRRRLRLRAGTYWEPSRYDGRSGRMHGTFGGIVRMFDFKVPLFGWRGICFQTAFDFATDYTNVAASIFSFWH